MTAGAHTTSVLPDAWTAQKRYKEHSSAHNAAQRQRHAGRRTHLGSPPSRSPGSCAQEQAQSVARDGGWCGKRGCFERGLIINAPKICVCGILVLISSVPANGKRRPALCGHTLLLDQEPKLLLYHVARSLGPLIQALTTGSRC